MISPEIIGAVSNAIRGGQWRLWLTLDEDDTDWISSDLINSFLFMLTVWAVMGDAVLAGMSFLAMWAGASMGWGAYIGSLMEIPGVEKKENTFIDPLIAWIDSQFWWGFMGLFLRGLVWGLCLSIPFAIYGYMSNAVQFVFAGGFMPVAYYAARVWVRTRVGENGGAAWGLGEVFFGAVLWQAVGG